MFFCYFHHPLPLRYGVNLHVSTSHHENSSQKSFVHRLQELFVLCRFFFICHSPHRENFLQFRWKHSVKRRPVLTEIELRKFLFHSWHESENSLLNVLSRKEQKSCSKALTNSDSLRNGALELRKISISSQCDRVRTSRTYNDDISQAIESFKASIWDTKWPKTTHFHFPFSLLCTL